MSDRQVMQHGQGKHEVWLWPSHEIVSDGEWRWENFTPEEMACRGTGVLLVEPLFMDEIQRIRTALGFPLQVTSGYRSPDHNASVSSTQRKTGPHVDAQAIDVHVTYADAYELICVAASARFRGIGVCQHGDIAARFIHLDNWFRRVKPALWTYNAETSP